MNGGSSYKTGIGFFGFLSVVLTAVFTVLKLIDKIDWSWVWVLSPLWIYCGLTLIVTVVIIILYTVVFKNLFD